MLEANFYFTLGDKPFDLFPIELVSTSKDSFAYLSYASALDEPEGGNGAFDLYRAQREVAGWKTTDRLTRPPSSLVWPIAGGISPDQTYSFSNEDSAGHIDYLRGPDGSFQLTGRGTLANEPFAQGRYISEGGEHVLFTTGTVERSSDRHTQSVWCQLSGTVCHVLQLDSKSPPPGTGAIYDRSADGLAHVVSLLPGDVIPAAGEQAFYEGTSKNASSVAFSIGEKLYVRIHNGEAADEETLEVAAGSPAFAGLSADGRYLFYVADGESGPIHRFDTTTDEHIEVNPTGGGEIVNVSADGSHVYFISPSTLTGPEKNDQGNSATPPAEGTGTLSAAKGTGTLSAAKGTGTLIAGSNVISGVSTSEGPFTVGMEISGFGIPVGTMITEVNPETLGLSKSATQSRTSSLAAGSNVITGVTTSEGTFTVGMEMTGNVIGNGIQAGTTITEVTSGTLVLSNGATASGTRPIFAGSKVVTGVTTSEGSFQTGMAISGNGIPGGTTIAEVGAGVLQLSHGVTATGVQNLLATFPNLYVWTPSEVKYVATVAPSDLEQTSGDPIVSAGLPALTNWTAMSSPSGVTIVGPGGDSSRTTPDGTVLVFESRGRLTSYENADHTEIYRYDSGDESLTCVSCNPSGTPAQHDSRLQEVHLVGPAVIIHNVSDDGSRVFFETDEALVPNDRNEGVNDIYEWQEGASGGAVALISSGESPAYPLPPNGKEQPFPPRPNLLLAIPPDGSNVFFMAKEALLPGAGENGTEAIYDARVGGGFAAQAQAIPCSEERCKPAAGASPSSSPGAGSETLTGSGNSQREKHRCRSKHKMKQQHKVHRCSKRHKKKPAARSSASAHASGGGAEGGHGPLAAAVVDSVQERMATPHAAGATATASLASSPEEFGIERFEADLLNPADKEGAPLTGAGMHPEFQTKFEFTHFSTGANEEQAKGALKDLSLRLPPGLLGNPAAVPTCSMGDFLSFGNCPVDSQVGLTKVKVGQPLNKFVFEPIYNLAPPHPDREVARLGFIAFYFPTFIDISVRTAGDYGVTATVHDAAGLGSVIRVTTTLWADPANPIHDTERLTPAEAAIACHGEPRACEAENEKREVDRNRPAFMTNPLACGEGGLNLAVSVYQLPGKIFEKPALLPPITDCTGLPFEPGFKAEPTSSVAGAPTGLKTVLKIPQHLGPDERATATMREARVTLPAGMQLAAGAANWIGTCSDDQVGFHHEVDTGCPDNSKLGTATIVSPDLPEPIEGSIYQRAPSPGHQLALWLTSDALGLHIKLPGELEPDKQTGRLTAVFRDLPEVPVEEIDLNVWGGPRAPLQNPDHCGSFNTDFSFSPHSNDPAASGQSTMQITEGCGQGFSPTLHAGVTDPVAGRFSPFVFDLTRDDGNQALRGFELHLPDGELAKLAGVPLCPDAAAASSNCPGDSRIGSLEAITGPGAEPLSIPQPGKAGPAIYFAGPYQGAPYSIVSEVPAQAGPFDLGILAVRSALEVDPETAQVTVKADPLPQFFEGVGIAYRNLHAVVDRPEFNLNPTNCSELQVTSDVTSTQGTVAHPSARFQVDGCKALKFKPKLSLKLKGGTKRADYPTLTAVLQARKGDANIAFTSVALPHSEFLAQEHIGTVCTRVQFAADKCPKRSVYGKAKATTPLLDKPLEGLVYLRSSDHPLPDLVVALKGQLEIDLVGRIDSLNGGIRATFAQVPDAPVSKFVLQMKGGAKGLFVNSTDICRGAHRASVAMRAQNGRSQNSRPLIAAGGCGKPAGRHKHHR